MKSDSAPGLTFHWPARRGVSFMLPGFILLSLFAHALAFYVFQVAYPTSASIASPPAQVSLLTPSNPIHLAMLRWIEAEDPAIASTPPEISPRNLFDLRYKPSYAEVHAVPKAVVRGPVPLIFPPARNPLAIIGSAIAPQQKVTAPIPAPRSVVRFSGALANRPIKDQPPIEITSKSSAALAPTRFLIGVSDRGEVREIFLQAGSGDKSIDDEAADRLQKFGFAPADQAVAWGFATFFWGGDAYPRQTEIRTEK